MKKIVILFLLIGSLSFAQTSVNNYEYVIVPAKFAFQNKNDQYRLNTLTKLILEKYGFKAFLDTDVLPAELIEQNCNKLYADVTSDGSFMTTRLKIILKDCRNNVLYISEEGKSKEKDWTKSYNEALRAASKSFEKLNYKYMPVGQPKEITAKQQEIVTISNQNLNTETLFAQPITNGFQLVDTTPKVVMKIFKTSNSNMFTAIKGTLQGVLVAKDSEWFFEYYENDKLISEKIAVKF